MEPTFFKRNLNASVVSTATAASATSIYLTLSWPAYSALSRIHVSSNNTFSNLTVTVVKDGAAYRAAGSVQAKAALIVNQVTDTNTAVNSIVVDMEKCYVEEANHLDQLHIILSTDTNFTTGSVFTVSVDGVILPARQSPSHFHPKGFRVLRVPASGATIDLTQSALQNINPYTLAAAQFDALTTTTDKLYIGAAFPLTRLWFNIPSAEALPAGTNLTAQVWNGSAWVSATVRNNTSDGQTSASTFSYTGSMELVTPSPWVPTRIATDPLSLDEDAINAASSVSVGALYNPNRYWLRLSVSALSSIFSMFGLRILE